MKALFCTDGSKISYNAIANFAKWASRKVTIDIICIIDWSFLPDEVIIEESGFVNNCKNVADTILEQAEKNIKELNLNIGEKIKQCGSAVESILEQSTKKNYDIIILGSHGKKGIQRWLGSVSREVLEATNLPTYISKNKNNRKNILFTTDGSIDSIEISKKAIDYLKLDDKNIHLCTVSESPDLLFLEGTLDSNWMMAIQTQQEIYSEKALKRLQNLFEKNKLTIIESKILEGTPAKSILEYAASKDIDLIILGANAKTKIQNFLLESVSKRIVENARGDTLIIKIKSI